MDRYDEILKEDIISNEKISKEETNFLVYLMLECKDIKDSEYGKTRQGNIVKLKMEREKDDIIKLSGALDYAEENRTVFGYIYYLDNDIIFDMHFTRLCVEDDKKEYSTLDKFIKTSDGYTIESVYRKDSKVYKRKIEEKGKVK